MAGYLPTLSITPSSGFQSFTHRSSYHGLSRYLTPNNRDLDFMSPELLQVDVVLTSPHHLLARKDRELQGNQGPKEWEARLSF